MAGRTASQAFPVTSGAFQTTSHGGLADCFVTKLNTTGSALIYSTLLGGSGLDECAGIALDAAKNAYVTGTTYSRDYPMKVPLQGTLGGTATAFVTAINPLGSGLLYSTFLGGSNIDNGNGIAVDSAGAAYVAGTTASADFPVTPLAFQTVLKGLYNAFVSKISPGGTSLTYSTLIGGSSTDTATAIAVDKLGRAIVGGYTTSTNFPIVKPIQPSYQGSLDAFATVLNPQGSAIVFSSYFGGSADDRASAVGASPTVQLFLAGMTSSTNFPTVAAFDSQSAPYDAFTLRMAYTGHMLIWQNDATTQVAEWALAGVQGSTYQSWSWLSPGSEIGWTLVGMADMNGDGYPDLIWQFNSTRQIAVWYMGSPQGDVFQSWDWLSAGTMTGWTLIGAVDLNADGHPDLIWENDSTRQVVAWYMGGAQGNVFQSWSWLSSGAMTGWTLVGAADFNGDGHADLVWQLDSTKQVAVWYMGGPLGNVYQSWNWLNPGEMTGSTVAGVVDLDGDGTPDLIWQNLATRAVTAWYMGSAQGNVVLSTLSLSAGLPGWTIRGCF